MAREPEAATPPLAPGALLAGRYRLGEVLGSGGYGVVYRALDLESGAPVAVKALRAERLTASVRQRLKREATLLEGLEHPHLVRVFAAGEADGVAYLTMELVEGEPLRERLLRGPLTVDEALRLTREMLEGLAALHARGIVHRDVKPGNVLLDRAGRARLADFGLVRRFETEATWATTSLAVVGTAEYLSPEQALGEEIDGRSDLYSLGVVLFEMLAGRPVHERRSTFAMVLAHLNQPAPDVRELRADTPAWLASVVERLLEKRRDERYASADEVLADLDRRRMPRGALRRRMVRSGVVAVAACALAAAVAGGWAWSRWRGGFAGVGGETEDSAVAVDRAGRVLWRQDGVRRGGNFVTVRLADGHRAVAAILAPAGASDAAERHRLALLDPQTGGEVATVDLPDAGPRLFAEFANRYLWSMRAFDLDGDGVDEVYVAYHHEVLWPSYVAVYDPARRRSGVIFAGSGHHRPYGAADVDGDGQRELLLLGTANRMGWYAALAAVRVLWVPGLDQGDGSSFLTAVTPDSDRVIEGSRSLAWYALLPPGVHSGDGPLETDVERKQIRVRYADGRTIALGFDGFRADEPGEAPAADRAATRERAFEAMRTATRALAAGSPADAVRATREMSALALAAGDRRLAEWGDRLRVRALVGAGERAAADALAGDLVHSTEAGIAVAMEAARAFHLAGDLSRALLWYERGLVDSGHRAVVRRCWEYLEGMVLVLAEQRRWAEIVAACERAEAIDPVSVTTKSEVYRAWVRLRAGQPPAAGASLPVHPYAPDLVRALRLEVELAAGGDPAALLDAVERERAAATETGFLLLSLRGELLARLGRPAEARAAAREALAEAERRAAGEIFARAFVEDLRERALRLERGSGRSPG